MRFGKRTLIGLAAVVVAGIALLAAASQSTAETSPEFVLACKGVGARFLRLPTRPVTSVALDYSPPYAASRRHRRFEFDSGDSIVAVGSLMWQPFVGTQIDRFEVRSEFGYNDPQRRFQRYERSELWKPVSDLSAQVVVTDTVLHAEELMKPLRQEGLVKHHLEVQDLRDAQKLAEMDFVVDMVHGRGCGVNVERARDVKRAIDIDQFILTAIGVPVVVPQWELERRRRAWIH